mmetsp:Transcript_14363/g.22282  ORF Transcript_14363/g.22282 Transcript_14363/m.22282 type:complete len:85 (+) Transcript_14363:579-833(+)
MMSQYPTSIDSDLITLGLSPQAFNELRDRPSQVPDSNSIVKELSEKERACLRHVVSQKLVIISNMDALSRRAMELGLGSWWEEG